MRPCGWCEEPIPAGKRPSARYCSDTCRKRACADRHRGQCVDCGARMHEGAAWRGHERCWACEIKTRNTAHQARLEDVAEMYREGLLMREIAAELGYGPNSVPPEINEARRLGLIGYRNRGYGVVA